MHVVIVNYRSASHVAHHLASGVLAAQDVVVVDNASEPGEVRAMCEQHGARAVLLDHNSGFAGGVNSAVAQLEDDGLPVLLLNPDVEISTRPLSIMLDALQRLDADGVAPLLMTPDGRIQAGVAGGALRARNVVAYFLFLSHLCPQWRGIFLTRRQAAREQRVAWVCMACALLRRDVFSRFGPLPEDELVYAEDVAWGTAATESGARLWLVPAARVNHESGASGGSSAWSGALERLIQRRLGSARSAVASASIRAGLSIRRWIRRGQGALLR